MGTKEYHAQKSRDHYNRMIKNPEWILEKREYKRLRSRQNKAKAVEVFGGICHFCKIEFPQCVFEFHHLKPDEKEYTPAVMFGLKWETIEKELTKCVMLCANCHRLEHERLKQQ